MMDKCLECGKELEHIVGKKKKKYCDETCKGNYFYKTNKGEPKYVQFRTFKELSDKFNAIAKERVVSDEEKKLFNKSPIVENEIELPDGNTIVYNPTEVQTEILKQISEIKIEKIPKERDTLMGRRVWANDQYKRIKELESKLKP